MYVLTNNVLQFCSCRKFCEKSKAPRLFLEVLAPCFGFGTRSAQRACNLRKRSLQGGLSSTRLSMKGEGENIIGGPALPRPNTKGPLRARQLGCSPLFASKRISKNFACKEGFRAYESKRACSQASSRWLLRRKLKALGACDRHFLAALSVLLSSLVFATFAVSVVDGSHSRQRLSFTAPSSELRELPSRARGSLYDDCTIRGTQVGELDNPFVREDWTDSPVSYVRSSLRTRNNEVTDSVLPACWQVQDCFRNGCVKRTPVCPFQDGATWPQRKMHRSFGGAMTLRGGGGSSRPKSSTKAAAPTKSQAKDRTKEGVAKGHGVAKGGGHAQGKELMMKPGKMGSKNAPKGKPPAKRVVTKEDSEESEESGEDSMADSSTSSETLSEDTVGNESKSNKGRVVGKAKQPPAHRKSESGKAGTKDENKEDSGDQSEDKSEEEEEEEEEESSNDSSAASSDEESSGSETRSDESKSESEESEEKDKKAEKAKSPKSHSPKKSPGKEGKHSPKSPKRAKKEAVSSKKKLKLLPERGHGVVRRRVSVLGI